MAQIVHIVGTDTGVGKTFVTAYLLWSLSRAGFKTKAIKPLASGSLEDARILCRFHVPTVKKLAEVTPFYFRKPLAPLMAATRANPAPSLDQVAHFVSRSQEVTQFLLVEGIGGVAVPIKQGFLYSSILSRVPGKVLIIASNRLGVLNHVLLTHEHVLRCRPDSIGFVLRNPSRVGVLEISNLQALTRIFPDTALFEIPDFPAPAESENHFEFLDETVGDSVRSWLQNG